MKCLLIADQPWQIEFLLKLAKKLNEIDSKYSFALVIADLYTFQYEKSFLSGVQSSFSGEIFTQENNFYEWQLNKNKYNFDEKYLKWWESNFCKGKTLEKIFLSNSLVNSFENGRYYKKISKSWHKKIIFDTTKWSHDIVENLGPDLIITINNFLYESYLFFLVAQKKQIPFVSIIPNRISNNFSIRTDFGYGMDKELYDQIVKNFSAEQFGSQVSELSEKLRKRNGSYHSISHSISENFFIRSKTPLKSLLFDSRKLAKRIYIRIFVESRLRPKGVNILAENHFLLSIIESRIIIIHFLRGIGVKFWGKNKIPTDKYFLWCLHVRPESSVMILGDGVDEIDKIHEISNALPDGYYLAVKENPIMFGNRRLGFYNNLRKNKKIILIDSLMPTIDLIDASIGVIGLSGTALLEAAILDKPSYALGAPEFAPFLIANGSNSVFEFIDKCISGRILDAHKKISPYLQWILEHSTREDFAYGSDLKNSKAEKFILMMSNKLHKFLLSCE